MTSLKAGGPLGLAKHNSSFRIMDSREDDCGSLEPSSYRNHINQLNKIEA